MCVSLNVLSNIWTTRSTWFISDTWTGLRGGNGKSSTACAFSSISNILSEKSWTSYRKCNFPTLLKMCLSPALARPGVSVWLKQQSLKWRSPGSSTWSGTTGRRWREQKQSIYNMLPPFKEKTWSIASRCRPLLQNPFTEASQMRTPGFSSTKWTNQKTWLVSDPARSSPPEPKPGALKREEGFKMWQWKDRRLVFSVGLGLTVLVQRAHKHTHVHSKRNSPSRNSHMTEKGVSVCVCVCMCESV